MTFKTTTLSIIGVLTLSTSMAFAQSAPSTLAAVEQSVVIEENCGPGVKLIILQGEVLSVEQYYPLEDGTYAGYRTSYDKNAMATAREAYDKITCQE